MSSGVDEEEKEAERLIASGYRTMSNRYRIVSRLDREDWLEHMAYLHTKGFPGSREAILAQGMKWATGLGEGAADFYRSVHSRDRLRDIPEAIYRKVKAAGHGSGWGGLSEYKPLIEP